MNANLNFYQKIYEKYYFRFFETKIKKRNTANLYNDSLSFQWKNGEYILFYQFMCLRELLKHAGIYCPYYADIFRTKSIDFVNIQNIFELSSIPILTKDIIKSNFDNIISKKNIHSIWNKSTGGSTGQPLHFAYTKESYEWRVAMSKRGYAWAGALPGAKQAYIWGVQLGEIGPLQTIKERLHHCIDRHIYFNCFEFDEQAMANCLARLNRFKPASIVGYTNPLYNLALFIGDNSKIRFKPQGLICAAEKVHPYQREVIERVFGAKVFNTYGSREFMLIAAECEQHEGLHISADNLIVEIIKDDGTPAQEGETGRIIVTDLHNYGMPFIRYEIGDLGVATSRSCSCGRGLPLIADVVGRSLDVIRTPEGKIIPGEFFPHLMKDFADVTRFQVVQEKLDLLIVKIVPDGQLNATTKTIIEAEVRKKVGSTMVVQYEIVSEIPLTASGKYRVAISKISGEQRD